MFCILNQEILPYLTTKQDEQAIEKKKLIGFLTD